MRSPLSALLVILMGNIDEDGQETQESPGSRFTQEADEVRGEGGPRGVGTPDVMSLYPLRRMSCALLGRCTQSTEQCLARSKWPIDVSSGCGRNH